MTIVIFDFYSQEEDIVNVKTLLQDCYEYYHSMKLSNDCVDTKCRAPPECVQHNAVYNILHFLVDIDFIKVNVSTQIVIRNLVFLENWTDSEQFYKNIQETSFPLDSIFHTFRI